MIRIAALAVVLCAGAIGQVRFVPRIVETAANGRILFAENGSGLARSTDSGATWTPSYVTAAGAAQPPFGRIAIDHRNDNNVFLATSPAAGGLWKSTDGGVKWAKSNGGLPETGTDPATYLKIANNGTIYIRFGTALYKSTDNGTTWTRIAAPLPGPSLHLDINFSNPNQMLYASGAAIWRSIDEGATWRLTSSLRTFADTNTGAACLQTDPVASHLVYACVAGPLLRVGNSVVTGLHRSVDGGSNFIPPADFPSPSLQPIGIFVGGNGSQKVYLQSSAGGYCRSSDQGRSIQCPADSTIATGIQPTSARLQHVSRQNADLLFLAAGTSAGGITYRSQDGGDTWRALDATIRPTLGASPAVVATTIGADSVDVVTTAITMLESPAAAGAYTATTSGESWFSIAPASGNTPASLRVTFRSAGLEPGRKYEGSIRIASTVSANASIDVPVAMEILAPVKGSAPRFEVTAFAGNGSTTFSGDGGPALEAGLGDLDEIAIDSAKNVYVYSSSHNRIRRIGADGKIETIAGNGTFGTVSAADGASAKQSTLYLPAGLAVDSKGVVYFGESRGGVRKIAGDTLGTHMTAASINSILDEIAVDSQDRVWALSILGRLYRHSPPAGAILITTTPALPSTTTNDFAIDPQGNVYVSTTSPGRVYKLSPTGSLTLYAGNGSNEPGGEGVRATATGLAAPSALACDGKGNVYVLEPGQKRVRVITPDGILYTAAKFPDIFPRQLAADADGNVYVSAANFVKKLVPRPTPVPVISGRPRNLASGSESVSPGGLFTLEGESLAENQEAVATPPMRFNLGATSVEIDDRPVPLSLASPGRITGQIPWESEAGTGRKLRVIVNGIASQPVEFDLVTAAPGILTLPEDPRRPAGAKVENGEATILVTGFGPVDPPVASGATVPEDPVSKAVLPWELQIGEATAEPIEIALVPGFAGVGKARFRLPEGLMPGDYDVIVRVDGQSSNKVLLSIP